MASPALTLYDHVEDVIHLASAIAQASTEEEAAELRPTLRDAIIGAKSKVDRCCAALAELSARHAAAQAEAQRLNERAQRMKRAENALREYLLYVLTTTKETALEGHTSTIARRRNPPRVSITEPGLVPAEFWRPQPAPPPELDRVAIRERIARGEAVPGCQMQTGYHLRIS